MGRNNGRAGSAHWSTGCNAARQRHAVAAGQGARLVRLNGHLCRDGNADLLCSARHRWRGTAGRGRELGWDSHPRPGSALSKASESSHCRLGSHLERWLAAAHPVSADIRRPRRRPARLQILRRRRLTQIDRACRRPIPCRPLQAARECGSSRLCRRWKNLGRRLAIRCQHSGDRVGRHQPAGGVATSITPNFQSRYRVSGARGAASRLGGAVRHHRFHADLSGGTARRVQ